MGLMIKKCIESIPEYVPGRTVEEVKEKYGLREVYKLASNENLYGAIPGLAEMLSGCIKNIYYYPDGSSLGIRKKISRVFKIPVENIIIGSGTDQIIEMICDSFIEPGDNIVIADPTFSIYDKAALKCGGHSLKVPLSGFRQDVSGLVGAVNKNTKVLFLTNPHNPTGTNITSGELNYVMENVDSSVLIVIDEAYFEYCPEEARVDTYDYIMEKDNLMILRTFSKIYGLAGLRIGYGMGPLEAVKALNRVRLPFNVNSIAQKAAEYVLEHTRHIEEIRRRINSQKEIYYNVLDDNKIEYIRSYTNFILIKTGKNSEAIVEELLRSGFIVRPGRNLGLPGYIRVTIATEEIDSKFLKTFTKIYKNFEK